MQHNRKTRKRNLSKMWSRERTPYIRDANYILLCEFNKI